MSRNTRQIIVLQELLNSVVFYQTFVLRFYKNLITAAFSNMNSEKKPRNIFVGKKKRFFLGLLDTPYVTAESVAFKMFMV